MSPPFVAAEQLEHALVQHPAQGELEMLQRTVEGCGDFSVPAEQTQSGDRVAAAERFVLRISDPQTGTQADAEAGAAVAGGGCR
ncbi:hypothetical protein AB0L65_07860 [Nonomuraea sp. NPDC052116]|uniref:hypothetical protein n=1 Tax=Nonomuraea sp. NPDC052116 TaxID=3155665 RepID=UPI003431C4BF